MHSRNSYLFPLMVLAAASVIAFGCFGILAITGRTSGDTSHPHNQGGTTAVSSKLVASSSEAKPTSIDEQSRLSISDRPDRAAR